jgi:hypothetical protein
MSAMSAAEGVVDVDVAERGELPGELGIVLLFLGVEAEIFEKERLAGLEVADHLGGDIADAIGREGNVLIVAEDVVEQLAQTIDDGTKAHGEDDFSLGAAEVRAEDDASLAAQGVFDGGDGLTDAGVVSDTGGVIGTIGRERNVEVDSDEDAFIGEVQVADRQLRHVNFLF